MGAAAPWAGAPSRTLLQSLATLRWVAVACQAATIYLVTGPMHVALAPAPLWWGVAALASFNLYATWRGRRARDGSQREVVAHLGVDVLVLTWLVAWSGGIENPFSSLFLLPIAISILALSATGIWVTAALSIAGYGVSAAFARPLPHVHNLLGDTFNLHMAGMFVNFVVSAAVILIFLTRVATAWRRREREIAGLRERFARNEGIVALATHAASVAHELNTPLGTLTLMLDDLAADANGELRDDFTTLRALVAQCRDRVRELALPADAAGADAAERSELWHVVERWQLVRPAIELRRSGTATGRERLDAAAGHLLLALLNNAADAGEQNGRRLVELRLDVDGTSLSGSIRDHGPGFDAAESVLPGTLFRTSKPGGLGIGLALSHATVERLGGTLAMQAAEGGGVIVSFTLPGTVRA
jgi:two-component system sensor histidine kinase RegB